MGFLSDVGATNAVSNLGETINRGLTNLGNQRVAGSEATLRGAAQLNEMYRQEQQMRLAMEQERRNAEMQAEQMKALRHANREAPYDVMMNVAFPEDRKPEQRKFIDEQLRARGIVMEGPTGRTVRVADFKSEMDALLKDESFHEKMFSAAALDMAASKQRTLDEMNKLKAKAGQALYDQSSPEFAQYKALMAKSGQQSEAYDALVKSARMASPAYRKAQAEAQAKFESPTTTTVSPGANVGVMQGGQFTPSYSAPFKPENEKAAKAPQQRQYDKGLLRYTDEWRVDPATGTGSWVNVATAPRYGERPGEERRERKLLYESERGMRKDFEALQEVKDYTALAAQFRRVEEAMKSGRQRGNLAAADQALITMFNKMTDPESVVRESEFERTPKYLPVVNRIQGKIEKLGSGGPGLTDEDRMAIYEMSKAFNDTATRMYGTRADEWRQMATEYGFKPDRVVVRGTTAGKPVAPTGPVKTADDYLRKLGVK